MLISCLIFFIPKASLSQMAIRASLGKNKTRSTPPFSQNDAITEAGDTPPEN